jgi:hypothetical protein
MLLLDVHLLFLSRDREAVAIPPLTSPKPRMIPPTGAIGGIVINIAPVHPNPAVYFTADWSFLKDISLWT